MKQVLSFIQKQPCSKLQGMTEYIYRTAKELFESYY